MFRALLLPVVLVAALAPAADSIASLLAQKRFAEALQIADSLLKDNPQDPRLWTVRGLALSGLEKVKDGLDSFDRALRAQPSFGPALQAASETAYRARDSRAASYLRRLLQADPASEPANAMAAVLAFEARDCTSAVKHFTASPTQVRGNDLAASQFGYCLLKTGQPDQAIGVFARQLAHAPTNSNARYNLAVAQLEAGATADALATLTPLASSTDSDVLNLLAAVQAASGRIEDAMATLRRAAVAAPQDERNYLDLALLCQKSGAMSLAVGFLDAGLKRLPQSARLFATRGVLRAQLGELEGSEADFERAASLEPDQTYAAAGLSVLFSETGRAQGAVQLLRQRLANSPDDPTLNCLLADALVREGAQPDRPEFAEAQQALRRAIRVRPDFARAHAALGKLYLREDKAVDAVRELELALRLDPANRPALSQLSLALRKAGRATEAAAVSERLRRQYERDLETETARQRVRLAP